MRSPFVDVFAALATAFDRAGVPWYLFGAQAAILYGSARLSADVDVTVDLGGASASVLDAPLAAAGFTSRGASPEQIAATRVLPVTHAPSAIPVDIVIAGPGLEELFLARAGHVDVGGARIPVARAEDVVAMKLLAGRPKDLEDVCAILGARAGSIDLAIVRETVALLEGALDRNDLTRALDQALAAVHGIPARPPRQGGRTRRKPGAK